jgi:hypothetical protein
MFVGAFEHPACHGGARVGDCRDSLEIRVLEIGMAFQGEQTSIRGAQPAPHWRGGLAIGPTARISRRNRSWLHGRRSWRSWRAASGRAAPRRRSMLFAASVHHRSSSLMTPNVRDLRRPRKSVRFPSPPEPFQLISGDHSSFQPRLTELEQMMTDIRERMAHVESGLLHLATKNDVTTLESTLLKWFIGTAIALTGCVFAAARLVH